MKSIAHLMAVIVLVCGATNLSACCGEGFQVTPVELSKKQEKNFKKYIGEWSGKETSLVIGADRMIHYKKGGGVDKSIDAPLQKFRHKKELEVGLMGITTIFKIDKPPKKKGGKWTMTIDGVKLTKK